MLGPDRNSGVGLQQWLDVGSSNDRRPRTGIVTRLVPAGHFTAGIVNLARLHIGLEDGAVAGLPAGVRGNHLRGAIRIFNAQLRLQTQFVAVFILADATDIAAKPAIPEDGADRIGPLSKQIGDIVSAVVDALAVVRPAGCKDLIPDPLTVEAHLQHPLGSCIKHGPCNRCGDLELLAQVGCRQILFGCLTGCQVPHSVLGNRRACLPVIDLTDKLEHFFRALSGIRSCQFIVCHHEKLARIDLLLEPLFDVHLLFRVALDSIHGFLDHHLVAFARKISTL